MLKAALSWSSGKDSAMALYRILKGKDFEIACLLTTISDRFHRISMHGVRESLLDAQAHSLNLPIEKVMIPYPCPNETYEEKMAKVLSSLKAEDVTHVIFGDLFLQEIRKYREENLTRIGMTPVFPLWSEDTSRLAREMIEVGFRAVITCVDPRKLNPAFAGCHFDQSFLEGIPANVDPCGENGEFHTFVYDGPIFTKRIPIEIGEIVMRDGFRFADVSLADSDSDVGNHSGPTRNRNSNPSM
jgi:uncharacterized protein (TIGR00290 family)